MNKYLLVALLTVGAGTQPIMCNDAQPTKKEKVEKARKASTAIACLGALTGYLIKTIAVKKSSTGDYSLTFGHSKRMHTTGSAVTLAALLTAIGYDMWNGDRGVIGAGFTHALNAWISQFVASLVVGVAL